jgi:hypothetical protein
MPVRAFCAPNHRERGLPAQSAFAIGVAVRYCGLAGQLPQKRDSVSCGGDSGRMTLGSSAPRLRPATKLALATIVRPYMWYITDAQSEGGA